MKELYFVSLLVMTKNDKNSVNEKSKSMYRLRIRKKPVWIELDLVGFKFSGRFQFHTKRENRLVLAWTEFAVLL